MVGFKVGIIIRIQGFFGIYLVAYAAPEVRVAASCSLNMPAVRALYYCLSCFDIASPKNIIQIMPAIHITRFIRTLS